MRAGLRLLMRLVARSVVARGRESLLVIVILGGEALLLSLGLSVVTSMYDALQRNVTATTAGHLQVYSSAAPEDLVLFAPPTATPEIGSIADYPRAEST